MSKKIHLLFPIEILNRELDFRLFQAVYAAQSQFRIYIGQTDAIWRVVQSTRGGLYVGKNIRPPRRKGIGTVMEERYGVLKANGIKILHLDEEGGVMAGDEERWNQWLSNRLDVCALDADDHVCTWGDYQKNFYARQNPPCKDNIQTTGHPRFDLYKPAHRDFYSHEVQALRERFGDFVLVNTNFALSNNRSGIKASFSKRFYYDDPRDDKRRMDHVHHWGHISRITVNFVEMITRLSIEMPQLNYIIRPHPSENAAFYKAIFTGVKNVQVVHEGSVGPWLLASKALIHDGCTTGMEAHFCDVPVINYKSVQDTRYDLKLPNLFGTQCYSENEVLSALQAAVSAREGFRSDPACVNDMARSLIYNFEHDSFKLLNDALCHVAQNVEPSEAPSSRLELRAAMERWRENLRARRDRDEEGAKLDKFYGFANAGLDRKMQAVQQILGKDVKYTVHSPRLMSVEC